MSAPSRPDPGRLAVPRRSPTAPATAAGRPRALHVIDVENLSGCSAPTTADLHYVLRCYLTQVGIRPDDSSLAATDVVLAGRAAFVYAAAGIRFCVGMGSSGADRALLRTIDAGWMAGRFGALVIASGDGIFSEVAASAAARGVEVWQVSGRGGTSRRLQATARRHVRLALGPQRTEAAAG
ncbi:hypothetical protein ACWKWC_04845 [Geodermatophilus nigrescens]